MYMLHVYLMKPQLTENIFDYYSFSFGSYWKRLFKKHWYNLSAADLSAVVANRILRTAV